VRHIFSKRNITLVNYIDDFIVVVPVQCAYEMFEITRNMLGEIGLEISESKTVFPTHVCNCLGIMINTKEFTLAIPDQKLNNIINMCKQFQKFKKQKIENAASAKYTRIFNVYS
jgi:hypothetical protein